MTFGKAIVNKKAGALFYESKTVEWWTPKQYIELAVKVMGDIDLDPASCRGANKIIGAGRFFSRNSIKQPWHGRIWLNPPYGKLTKLFINKLISEWEIGNVSQAIVLLNVITLDRGWFRPLWQFPMCFHYGRVKFTSPDVLSGKIRSVSTPPTGSVFIYIGNREQSFAKVFRPVGAMMKRF